MSGAAVTGLIGAGCAAALPEEASPSAGEYPWHTDIVSTTFWVGEIHDSEAADGSQVRSAYDLFWMESYGGCDGLVVDGSCETQRRTADNGYFPTELTPLENPFYLDLPFDDVNNPAAFAMRGDVIPWADDPGYAGRETDKSFSYMKNRWVRLIKDGRECYGQIQDAGPSVYDDADYVFGEDDRRPANSLYNGAGLDVSPALNGCLGFADLNGASDRVNWQFVEADEVPEGPWREIITSRQVQLPPAAN
ncbi:hypothetical protein H9638_11825 [Arthrobacter sp. Sa2BUA2]|uniref:Lipoprotein n=1 Tax=Arthrobacter pullicola TaxID=2762224 RepID=A0ABR8YJT2_9MICC|nr:hypothetical protein [Arthrobacter pullicola]MBD8044495.1 hypothetical protein [Arthrobacter pullicola]